MQTPVQSLDQLARQSRINYTVVEGSDTHKYFINMKFAEDTLYRMWKELTLNSTTDQTQYRVWDYPIKGNCRIFRLDCGSLTDMANLALSLSFYLFVHQLHKMAMYSVERTIRTHTAGDKFIESRCKRIGRISKGEGTHQR